MLFFVTHLQHRYCCHVIDIALCNVIGKLRLLRYYRSCSLSCVMLIPLSLLSRYDNRVLCLKLFLSIHIDNVVVVVVICLLVLSVCFHLLK